MNRYEGKGEQDAVTVVQPALVEESEILALKKGTGGHNML